MEEHNSRFTVNSLLKQVQTVVTLMYLSMVGVGMLYYQQKYSEFGINIFQYGDILYFLVAPFEDGFILLLCGIAIAILVVGLLLDDWIKENWPRFYTFMYLGSNKLSWSKKMMFISWPLTFIAILALYSQMYGDISRDKVLESEPISVRFSDGETRIGKLIGKTDTTLFLLEGTKVSAIPLSSEVKEIVINASFTADDDEDKKPEPTQLK